MTAREQDDRLTRIVLNVSHNPMYVSPLVRLQGAERSIERMIGFAEKDDLCALETLSALGSLKMARKMIRLAGVVALHKEENHRCTHEEVLAVLEGGYSRALLSLPHSLRIPVVFDTHCYVLVLLIQRCKDQAAGGSSGVVAFCFGSGLSTVCTNHACFAGADAILAKDMRRCGSRARVLYTKFKRSYGHDGETMLNITRALHKEEVLFDMCIASSRTRETQRNLAASVTFEAMEMVVQKKLAEAGILLDTYQPQPEPEPEQEPEPQPEPQPEPAVNKLFTCPLSGKLLTDPVIAADGHTYDAAAMRECPLSRGHSWLTHA